MPGSIPFIGERESILFLLQLDLILVSGIGLEDSGGINNLGKS